MNDSLLTVKEVAEITGLSTQYIYKQMGNVLKPYVVSIDNKKCLKNVVLSEFFKIDTLLVANQNNNDNNDFISYLKEEIIFKNKQLEDKDKIIENKDRQIEEMTNNLAELSERIAMLFENAQQLQQTQQLLEAQNAKNNTSKPKKSLLQRIFGSKNNEDKEKSEND
jgi:hypothetical protein